MSQAIIPANDYLTFDPKPFPPQPVGHSRNFSALCGDNPPTITDGYGKWNVIDRPLRQGVTIPGGFNPARLKIEIRFGVWDGRFGFQGWDTGQDAAEANERDIDNLHWMAGGGQVAGASPAIRVGAFRPGSRKQLDLVPRQYHHAAWVIDGGVEWGTALRNRHTGKRIYQEASFVLLGFLGLGVAAPKPSNSQTGGYFKTTHTIRTVMAIAASPFERAAAADRERLANQIRAAYQNNPCRSSHIKLSRKSITQFKLPVGLDVWVPSHHI